MNKEYNFTKSPLFPNNEIFFITAEIYDNKIAINIPDYYKTEITNLIQDVNIFNFCELAVQDKIISGVSSLLNIPNDNVEFKSTIIYQFTKREITVSNKNRALYNKKYNFENSPHKLNPDSPIYNIFKNFPHCTGAIKDNDFVSFSCTENGNLSVETHPDYVEQGFATDCVILLVHELLSNNSYPEINFPTTVQNLAARRVAEKAGFEEKSKGFCIAINADLSLIDSEFLETGVERIKNYT